MSNQYRQVVRFPHLLNPLDTLVKALGGGKTSGASQTEEFLAGAPQGKLQLSKDPLLNHAIWNSIYSGLLIGGGAFLTALIANKLSEKTTRKAVNEGVQSRLEAVKPTVIADPDLQDLTAYTALPKTDMDRMQALLNKELPKKNKAINKKAGDGLSNLGDFIANVAKKSIALTLPIAATATAAYGGIQIANDIEKRKLRRNLNKELASIRNAQAFVDRKILEEQGLVTPVNALDKKAADYNLMDTFLGIPGVFYMLAGLGSGGIVYSILRNRDKNLATTKYLQKMQFGKNELGTAPQLSVLDLPAAPEEMLVLPGDRKKQTFSDDSDNGSKKAETQNRDKKESKELTNGSVVIDVEPIDKADIVTPVKKDALFI